MNDKARTPVVPGAGVSDGTAIDDQRH